MALVLDERCQAALARRRAHGKDARLFVRFERGSMRAGVPWVVATGWVRDRLFPENFNVQHIGSAEVHVEGRIDRYCRANDLTVSAGRLWPFEWLVIANPYMADEIVRWERTQNVGRHVEGISVAEPIELRRRQTYSHGVRRAR